MIAQAEACFKHCSIGTWSYAAIRNRTVCTCGDTFNKYGSAPESECSTACPEESSVFDHCGGPEFNSVYSIGAVIPKVPWPVPSVGPPTVGNPTPLNPDSNINDHSGHDHSTNKAAVISGSIVVVVIIVSMVLMFVRRKKPIETQPIEKGPVHGPTPTAAREGASSGDRRTLLRDDLSKGGGTTWSAPEKTQLEMADRDIEAQLFADFESCAVEGGPLQEHQPVVLHPLASHQRPSQDRHHYLVDIPTLAYKDQPSPSLYPVSNDNIQQSRVPSFVSKISEKLSHLRVKTQYLQPPQLHKSSSSNPSSPCPSLSLSPSPSSLSGSYPPVSPISPISPGFVHSPEDPQQQHLPPCPPVSIKATQEEEWEQGDTENRAPSFSTISAPIPGPVSNNNHCRKQKRLSSHSHHHLHQSWNTVSDNSAGSMCAISMSSHPQTHQTKAQADKHHRSKLIQDLILHGD
ncbi:hypothetical protein EMPS_08736 [Entomortierella parvispora]|uniref:WSC domain-containing protein n=1 Tax=Entomortierella parvispora TaxID=205924 RepID=A0A9P3HGV3_9FUNG|nr:hypothetical protein EMPS_08736 [Entomortierella parvispora]